MVPSLASFVEGNTVLLGGFPTQVIKFPIRNCMDCAICCNQQQINVAMVMVQVYFGRNCIEHFKGFNSMYSFLYQMWVLMSAFFSFKNFV